MHLFPFGGMWSVRVATGGGGGVDPPCNTSSTKPGHDTISLWAFTATPHSNLSQPELSLLDPFVKTARGEFHWNSCIHLIWCHIWIAYAPGDVWLWAPPPTFIFPFPFKHYVKKPITKSEWWNVISSELIEGPAVATSCLHPPWLSTGAALWNMKGIT